MKKRNHVPYERIKRYISRHEFYCTAERAGGRVVSRYSKDFVPPKGIVARIDLTRRFNWAREQGSNRGTGVPKHPSQQIRL